MSPLDVAVNGAQDTLGQVQSPGFQADVFEITYIPPTHVIDMKGSIDGGIFVHPAGTGHVLTDADIGKTVEFIIRYDIPTDYGGCANGVVQNFLCTNLVFTNTGGTPLSLTNVTSEWLTRNRYRVTWKIADGDEQFGSINVIVAGGVGRKDDTNIKNTDFELVGVFSIDTKNPTVGSVAPSAATIRSGVPASGVFTLTVAYSEPMDMTSTPLLSFPNQSLGALLSPTGGSWIDSTHYAQNFAVGTVAGTVTAMQAKAALVFPAVDVMVAGARDANGNLQSAGVVAGVFAVNFAGAAAAAAIPTLSTWGLLLLGTLLMGLTAISQSARPRAKRLRRARARAPSGAGRPLSRSQPSKNPSSRCSA
ncbi:IPTL-CTERM sorting domain-containing protein [Acidovorax sp. Root267]|uniref:IPTL-CTERM sorting domain-containing protein n=1 Tax=Acidovorax sp. Root267 TaxID=1736505 RepID=UPI0013017611|nr:IPTL-CTERM sorting domain-containing protein [Acidovorax sp. Root267]